MNDGEPFRHVWFPLSGVVSLVVLMKDGRGVDAATVGFEGMVGAPVVLGTELSQVTVQIEGEALRVPAPEFCQLLQQDPALRDVLLRYIDVLLTQALRSTGCNRLHGVEERLARWLLTTHDWVWRDQFHLTQDFLALMLGVRRPSVTVAAGALQQKGMITYRRGDVAILDREALERTSCEDYEAIRDAFERLLALPATG
ncbi:MAG TPA: Crp/Fnr family transcriptional regulator [Chloroflexota bacterium]|nr:Crp/Fnr family transcriptional regulator [Chloroflexota bacterium]